MKAVDLSLRALDQCDAIFGHLHMWETVRVAMRPMIEKSNGNRDKIVTDDMTAARFVISVIAGYLEQQIATGNFHVDRGTLGLHGQSLRNIAETALSYLEESKAISHANYLHRLETLDHVVTKSGVDG